MDKNNQNTQESLQNWATATQLVHGGTLRSQFGETSEGLFLSSGYVYDTAEDAEARFKGESEGYIYSRFANPTVAMFENRMKGLEGAPDGRATATGMAAVTAAFLCRLQAGDHIVSARALFGSCRYIVETMLPRLGIESTLIDGRDLHQWEQACRPNTKAFFFETPTNPTLELVDIKTVCELAHSKNAYVVVDNVFATPLLQKPYAMGADVVIYSATKHIDGQGRCLAGMVLSNEEFVADYLHQYMRQSGPSISPFNAWVMLKGLETLPLRVAHSTNTAHKLADMLAEHKDITRVFYPGREDHPQYELAKRQMSAGSNMVAFEIKGQKEEAFRFMNALNIISISNNLGDAKSLITHPATTTHQRLEVEQRAELGINDCLVRLSVGLEDANDLIDDIEQALAASQK
ncbi:MAG: O-succinylhomoserine sulfhydrylase [Pseudomonadota bacterium]